MPLREPCAGAVVLDGSGRLLLIKRGQPPSQGSWSVPGGRCRAGEPAAAACVREVREETGLQVRVLRSAGRVERDGPSGQVYDIEDFVCELVADGAAVGELRPGDDAADARWVSLPELTGLDLAPGLLECLTAWDLLPRC